MDYLRSGLNTATEYLGLTKEDNGQPLATAAPSEAVPASQLETRKDLNDEILRKGPNVLNSNQPDLSAKSDLHRELLDSDRDGLLQHHSSLPDSSAKDPLHRELLNSNKDDLLHHQSSLPDSSAKNALHNELLHADKDQLLNHNNDYNSELRTREAEYQPVALESKPEMDFDKVQRNPLDRNMDGKVDSRDFQETSSRGALQGQRLSRGYETANLVRAEPTRLETIQKDVVVHERIHPMQKEEIQPIIYREREQLDVKQVTQMMHETQIQPTMVQHMELPAERREAIIERSAPIAENYVESSRVIDATARTQVVHAPIVEEVIKKTIVQEVQPVLERDVIVPSVVQTTVPIYEKIIEAPHVYREEVIGNRRSSQTYSQEYLQGQRMSQGYDASLLQNISQGYTQETLQGRRLSQNFEPTLGQKQIYNEPLPLPLGLLPTDQKQYPVQMQGMNTQARSSQIYNQPQQVLATGQVLPSVQSSRPAWSHLPEGYVEQRPVFMGSSSQYASHANTNGLPSIQNAMYNPYVANKSLAMNNVQLNQAQAPQTLNRQ